MAQYEAQKVEYPSGILTEGGAPDIDTFCTIVTEEADAEGVRGEVVFEQAMLETGWLQFGGDASAGQFNFSGLGDYRRRCCRKFLSGCQDRDPGSGTASESLCVFG